MGYDDSSDGAIERFDGIGGVAFSVESQDNALFSAQRPRVESPDSALRSLRRINLR